MPEQRLAKTRATLPRDYQFGHGYFLSRNLEASRAIADDIDERAAAFVYGRIGEIYGVQRLPEREGRWLADREPWKPAHINAAVRLGWNTIEPD